MKTAWADRVHSLLPADIRGFAREHETWCLSQESSRDGEEENPDQRLIHFCAGFLLFSKMMFKETYSG